MWFPEKLGLEFQTAAEAINITISGVPTKYTCDTKTIVSYCMCYCENMLEFNDQGEPITKFL